MAENGNRGPNDFRARNGKRRREPPIIDASATEVPLVPATPPDGAGPVTAADAAPLPGAEAEAPETAEPAPAGGDPSPADAPARETAEPVLFGSARREPLGNADDGADADTAPPAAEAASVLPPAEEPVPASAAPPPPSSVPPGATPAAAGGGAAPWLLTLSTLVLLGALAWVLYTGPQRGGADALASQLADLKGKVAALEARPDPAQIQGSVAGLDKRVAAADADRQALSKAVAGLTTRLDAVAQQAQGARADADSAKAAPLPTGTAAAATVGALAALAVRVEGVDSRVSTVAADQTRTAKAVADLPKPVAPDFGPVDARLAALDAQLTGKVAAIDGRITALDGKVNGSDARLNGFDAKVNAVDGKVNGFDARMNGLDGRTNALEARLNDAANQVGRVQAAVTGLPKVDLAPLQAATAALDGKVSKVEGQLAAAKDGTRATEARAVGSADEARATPIALVGQAVQRAIADGRPYAGDLDALKVLGAEPDALAKLSPLAAKGAPTATALKAGWDAVAGDVLAAVKPAETGNALDRLAANARALVQVRRVGAVPGDDPSAVVSQVGAALDAGDVPGALAAWGRLPPAGQDRSKDWAAAARARTEAAQAAQGLVGRAIATLGKIKS